MARTGTFASGGAPTSLRKAVPQFTTELETAPTTITPTARSSRFRVEQLAGDVGPTRARVTADSNDQPSEPSTRESGIA